MCFFLGGGVEPLGGEVVSLFIRRQLYYVKG